MSEQSWRNEFYPVPAGQCPKEDALAHSVLKWRGLLKRNLKKHLLRLPPISVSAGSCALCQHWYGEGECEGCSLAEYLERSCYRNTDCASPYTAYMTNGDPQPMISALRATQNALQQAEEKAQEEELEQSSREAPPQK